jgi:hypothetical protein
MNFVYNKGMFILATNRSDGRRSISSVKNMMEGQRYVEMIYIDTEKRKLCGSKWSQDKVAALFV